MRGGGGQVGPLTPADLDLVLGSGGDRDENLRSFRARLVVQVDLPPDQLAERVRAFLKDPSPAVRSEAVRAVCKSNRLPRSDLHRLVIPVMADPDRMVRTAALEHLLRIGPVELVDLDTLRPFFASDSLFVHRFLLARVQEFGEKAAPLLPELGKSLSFPDDEIKTRALTVALGMKAKLTPLAKDLIALSRHDQPAFRWEAVQCLKKIGPDEPGVLAALFDRLSDGAELADPPRNLVDLAAQSFADAKVKARLIADLPPVNPKAPPVWQFTAVLLDEMRPFKTAAQVKEIKAFVRPAEKRSAYAQYYAAECLAEAGAEARAGLDDLLAGLADPKVTYSDVRAKLCEAVGNCGPEASRGARLLADLATFQLVEDRARKPDDVQRQENQKVRTAALRALGRLGPGAADALPALTKLADPASADASLQEVVKALGNLGPTAAPTVPKLLDLFLRVKPDQFPLIVDAVKKVGPGAYPPILDFIPKFDRGWRAKTLPYRDQLAKCRGCLDCIIALGPPDLKPEQRKELADDLKSLRAAASFRGDTTFQLKATDALAVVEKK